MLFCELQDKEVINICDGKCLGCVSDVSFCSDSGRIENLIIPGPGKCFGLCGRDFDLWIPWCKICKIGPDTILVEIEFDKCKHKHTAGK